MKYVQYCISIGIFVCIVYALPPRTIILTVVPQESEKEKVRTESIEHVQVVAPIIEEVQTKLKSVAIPITRITPIEEPALPPVLQTVVNETPIDLRSVVAIACVFKNASNAQVTIYGSGVVINADGYILTARHVVDMGYTYRITDGKQGLLNYTLDSCRIAIPANTLKTPTPTEIRTLNPFTPVTEFTYEAQLAFVPPEPSSSGMSDNEYRFIDSALLRITSTTLGVMPRSFIASPMKITELPNTADEIVSFGFPSGIPSYGTNFYLQGSVGEIQDIVGGNQLFKNQPVGMTLTLETIGGRSGSPVFWRGYVVGVISSKQDHSRNTAVTAIFPLARFAEEAEIAIFK